MSAMPHLRIADLLANAPVDPEAHLDAARVERYAQMLDALPPVVVFNTPEGLLLVDGYHRVALRAAVGWRRSQRRCATARGKTRCATLRRWALHSVASLPRRLPGTSGDIARTAGLQGAEHANFVEHGFRDCLENRIRAPVGLCKPVKRGQEALFVDTVITIHDRSREALWLFSRQSLEARL